MVGYFSLEKHRLKTHKDPSAKKLIINQTETAQIFHQFEKKTF